MLIYTRQTSLSSPILVCDELVHSLFGDQDSPAAEAPAESMVITDSEDRAVTIINPWQQQSPRAWLSFVLLTSSDDDANDVRVWASVSAHKTYADDFMYNSESDGEYSCLENKP